MYVSHSSSQAVQEGLIEIVSMGVHRWYRKGTCVVRYQYNKPTHGYGH